MPVLEYLLNGEQICRRHRWWWQGVLFERPFVEPQVKDEAEVVGGPQKVDLGRPSREKVAASDPTLVQILVAGGVAEQEYVPEAGMKGEKAERDAGGEREERGERPKKEMVVKDCSLLQQAQRQKLAALAGEERGEPGVHSL